MSKLIVEICKVNYINEHPNADRLELLKIKGWDVVAGKDIVKEGDLVVFIPPDAVLPESLHEFLGITKYCAELPKNADGSRPSGRRVKAARLRGMPSYGTIMTINSFGEYFKSVYGDYPACAMLEGDDVCETLGITKWEPPIKCNSGDAARENVRFHKYTSIERWNNFPDLFTEDDTVIITEKIHGTNCRVGFGQGDDYEADASYSYYAGSHAVRRKKPEEGKQSLYWLPYELCPRLREMLFDLWGQHCADNDKSQQMVIVFGEIYGVGVQDMQYDQVNAKGFRAFDISIGGEYMGAEKYKLFKKYDIPHVPILHHGKYTADKVQYYTDGETVLGSEGKFKGREGVVITSATEGRDPLIGRKILKSVSVDYLDRKGGTDSH